MIAGGPFPSRTPVVANRAQGFIARQGRLATIAMLANARRLARRNSGARPTLLDLRMCVPTIVAPIRRDLRNRLIDLLE